MDLITEHFEWFLFTGLLITRLIDIGTTYLVTPKLILETNPVARKFKWPYAWLTLLICLIPFWNTVAGLVVLVISLMVGSANVRKVWMLRSIGEKRYYDLLKEAVGKNSVLAIIVHELISSLLLGCVALLLMILVGFERENWAFWFAIAILLYAAVLFIYYSLFVMRIGREVKKGTGKVT